MYIISNFHDYYDTAIGLGIDKSCIYKRETITLGDSRREEGDGVFSKTGLYKDRREVFAEKIGFCGEIFPLIRVEAYEPGYGFTSKCFYSLEGTLAYYDEIGLKWKKKSSWLSAYTKDLKSKDVLKAFFEEKSLDLLPIFTDKKVPVFLKTKSKLILNPKLLERDFQKVKDAYATYQEIFMYLSGVLGNTENPTITLSDKDKRDKKGFDNWSFKTRPKA